MQVLVRFDHLGRYHPTSGAQAVAHRAPAAFLEGAVQAAKGGAEGAVSEESLCSVAQLASSEQALEASVSAPATLCGAMPTSRSRARAAEQARVPAAERRVPVLAARIASSAIADPEAPDTMRMSGCWRVAVEARERRLPGPVPAR